MCCLTANAQKAVVKTNLLYDLAATANVGVEWGVTPHWTIDLSANYNGWTFGDNKKWKHWLLQPEARYWLCERFNGHFVGAHLLGGTYNLGNLDTDFKLFGTDFGQLKDYRFEGWMVVPDLPTVIIGFFRADGALRQPSASVMSIPVLTNMSALTVATNWKKTESTIISGPPRRLLT